MPSPQPTLPPSVERSRTAPTIVTLTPILMPIKLQILIPIDSQILILIDSQILTPIDSLLVNILPVTVGNSPLVVAARTTAHMDWTTTAVTTDNHRCWVSVRISNNHKMIG